MSHCGFVHLRVYSDYSLGLGICKVKDLVKTAAIHNFPAVALTDKNNLFASLEFAQEASKNGLQPINGLALTIKYQDKIFGEVLLLCRNKQGYLNLLQLSTKAYLNKDDNDPPSVNIETLKQHGSGLIALVLGRTSLEFALYKDGMQTLVEENINLYASIFGKFLFIEIQRTNNDSTIEQNYENHLLDLALKYNIPVVATNEVSYLKPKEFEAQDAFMCIAQGRYIIEDDRPKASKHNYFKTAQEMSELFDDLPEAIENTLLIAQLCQHHATAAPPLLPSFCHDEDEELRQQSRAGLAQRITHFNDQDKIKEYQERLEYELDVITKMKYGGYFLIVSDFIKWSKANDIPVGPGRGSGAGSIVAWAMEITDLDPIRFGLLFERFLNPERVSMPDFDIDFCQDRREEVIDYVRQKYGDERVAQIITFGKLQARAVLRDVGRVLHMPYGVIDRICKMVPNNPAKPVTLKEAIDLDKDLRKSAENDPEIDRLLKISLQLEGLNRHVSTHAAGVIIGDRPLVELAPLYRDGNSSMPAVQFSMKYAESAGLVKFDFLGLKTLTVISWACKLINRDNQSVIDITKIPLEDKKTFDLLSAGDTVGVFQFESAGMKEAIKKLKPDCIDDLIALGSLYRPGPMDNIPSYINRKHGLEAPEYLHPLMESILKETYGIIVYQEQVMEIARALGGYTMGGADLLRRAMGKKIKAEMDAQRAIFVDGAVANNIPKKLAEEIFALMEKFASYGFNKSHAAAYALVSYQTAYLKANYPLEFLVASLNLEINDTDKINLFITEAKSMGIKILPPDINYSHPKFTIENGSIRYALGALKGVGVKAMEEFVSERNNGPFTNLFKTLERAPDGSLNKRILDSLFKAGAFDQLEANRNKLVTNLEILNRYISSAKNSKDTKQIGLFGMFEDEFANLPKLIEAPKWSSIDMLKAEFESFGFYLSTHPIENYKSRLAKLSITPAAMIEAKARSYPRGVKIALAGVVISKKIRSSPKGKFAFIQISDPSGLIETSIFNEEMLVQNEELLKVGNLVYAKADARIDDTGLRCIIESISSVEKAVSNVSSYYKIVISDKSVIAKVRDKLSNTTGREVYLSYKLETGEIVNFNFKNKVFLDELSIEQLSQLDSVEISEH